jgi:hypothetical protein
MPFCILIIEYILENDVTVLQYIYNTSEIIYLKQFRLLIKILYHLILRKYRALFKSKKLKTVSAGENGEEKRTSFTLLVGL